MERADGRQFGVALYRPAGCSNYEYVGIPRNPSKLHFHSPNIHKLILVCTNVFSSDSNSGLACTREVAAPGAPVRGDSRVTSPGRISIPRQLYPACRGDGTPRVGTALAGLAVSSLACTLKRSSASKWRLGALHARPHEAATQSTWQRKTATARHCCDA